MYNRIIVIGNYYEPENTSGIYLVTNLYEGLATMGWVIDLYVPSPSRGITAELAKEYYCRKEVKCNGNLRIYRLPAKPEGSGIIKRTYRYFQIQKILYKYAKKSDADLVFCQSTPPIIGLTAGRLAKKKKIPFIYNLHDVFPDSLVHTGITKKNSLLFKIGRIIENKVYKNAAIIVTVSEDIKENIIAKGVSSKKIRTIYNWIDEGAISRIERKENSIFERFGLSRDKFYVLYAGNLGKAQNLEVILNAAKRLETIPEIQFVIVGNGVDKEYYINRTKKMQLNNIHYFPLQPYSDVSMVYSLGDVSIVSCKAGVGSTAMPSKTYSIMATKTPIIACYDGNSSLTNLINDSACGYCVAPNDDGKLAVYIEKLLKAPELAKELGDNGYKYLTDHFTKKNAINKYHKCLKEVLVITKGRGI